MISGDDLRAARMSRGVTLGQLARMIGRDKGHLSRVETGRGRDVTPALVRDYERALGMTIAATVALDPSRSVGDNVDDVRRRQLLGGIGAIAASLGGVRFDAVIGLGEGTLQVYETDVESLRAPTMTYRRMEQRLPSRSLIAPVAAHLSLVRQLASRNPGRNLDAVVSEAAGLAAWLYTDLDDRANAHRHYQIAIKAAETSGHPLLVPYMRASLGHYLALTGDAVSAVDLVGRARVELAGKVPRIATVWIDAVDAVVSAAAGDDRASVLLGRAECALSALDGEEPVWPWVFRLDHPKLAAYRAVASVRLGRLGDAVDAFIDAYRAPAAPKQRAVHDVERAKVLLGAGQVEEACSIAVRAFDSGRQVDSDRVLNAVADFRSQLGVSRSITTRELDDRLDDLRPRRP